MAANLSHSHRLPNSNFPQQHVRRPLKLAVTAVKNAHQCWKSVQTSLLLRAFLKQATGLGLSSTGHVERGNPAASAFAITAESISWFEGHQHSARFVCSSSTSLLEVNLSLILVTSSVIVCVL